MAGASVQARVRAGEEHRKTGYRGRGVLTFEGGMWVVYIEPRNGRNWRKFNAPIRREFEYYWPAIGYFNGMVFKLD